MFAPIFAVAGKILGMIPWWVWPVAGLVGWGYYEMQRADGYKEDLDEIRAAQQVEEEGRAARTKMFGLSAIRSTERRNAELDTISRRLAAAQRELRNRPERRPEAATEACQGGTGAGLSRPDSGFLEGEAARANRLRAALRQCYEWIDDAEAAFGAAGLKAPER